MRLHLDLGIGDPDIFQEALHALPLRFFLLLEVHQLDDAHRELAPPLGHVQNGGKLQQQLVAVRVPVGQSPGGCWHGEKP